MRWLLVLPTLAFSKGKSQVTQCMGNFNQLAKACVMYASDNQEFYPPNPDDGNTVPGYNWCPGNVAGWAPNIAASGSADAGNATYLTNSTYNLLATYLGHSAVPFKCPTDWRVCLYQSNVVPVVRSVSANAGVGTADASWLNGGSHAGLPQSPVNGPWLNGSHSHKANQPYATFGKSTSFKNCSPSEIWVYADEDPWSINDGGSAVIAATPTIIDYPTSRHQNGSGFGFCDGHAEMHRWKSSLFVLNSSPSLAIAGPGLQTQDWFWFAWHATRSTITGSVP